jgi:hypothetical protein
MDDCKMLQRRGRNVTDPSAVNADDAKESSENESNVVALDVRTSLPLATVLSSNANKQSLVVSEHGERFIFTSTTTHARKKCGAVRFLSGPTR